MTDIETLLSDPLAVEQYRSIVEIVLLVSGSLTESTRALLEQRAIELGVHRLDAEQALAEVLALPAVQAAAAIRTELHERAQKDHETLLAERFAAQNRRIEALAAQLIAEQELRAALAARLQAEQSQREALAVQVQETLANHRSQIQNLVEPLQRRLVSFEQTLNTLTTTGQPSASIQVNRVPPPSTPVTGRSNAASLPDGVELVRIPAGNFTMGSTEASDEQPVRTVYLDAYSIYKCPVTVQQYRQFCTASGRQMPAPPDFNRNWSREDHPIVNVGWEAAVAYCRWAGGLLPTEAQWEKAARGTDSRRYPWGAGWNTECCVNRDNSSGTQPVGRRSAGASPYGVLDMAGNVWEWCADWYDEEAYRHSASHNPSGPKTGSYRVLRGGSWNSNNSLIFRCAFRFRTSPDGKSYVGFRCVVA